APPETAPPETAPPGSARPAVLPPPSGGNRTDDPAGKIAIGEGSTLPPVPALDGGEASRLPAIGAAEDSAAMPSDRPIDLYARPFDNPAGKPVYAVILIDTGEPALDRAALAALPFPVTFALDPLDPEAPARAAIYRAAGQEVVMLATGVPRGGTASDVAVAFQTMDQALPEAVAVMDLPERRFQADRPLAALVVPAVGDGGRGIVSWDEGLNAADQVARREDVPAALVFRALDGDDESAPVIRRYLDRAAFKAVQDGQVVVVGHTRPRTVAALTEWALEGRAGTVALAPVTAVLTVE
ncbi:MAG: divergent polysaccharide deacetylase family protein, partial [Rhodobacteraceae bacterium]|nr:divergent polysaccharide deacetylase family protein [Paracoccaceae bacterium]